METELFADGGLDIEGLGGGVPDLDAPPVALPPSVEVHPDGGCTLVGAIWISDPDWAYVSKRCSFAPGSQILIAATDERKVPASRKDKPVAAPIVNAPPVDASAPTSPPAPVAAPEPVKALVAAPQTTAAEISAIVGKDVSGMQVVMALVAVAGGGAAFKFYQSWQKNRHEERMAQIANQSQKSDDQHQKCSADRIALETRLAETEKRLADVAAKAEKAVSSGPSFDMDGFDPEAIEKRLAKLEKAAKTATKKR